MNLTGERMWSALPVPAFRLEASGAIAELNPAAEEFVKAPLRAVAGMAVWDALAVDASLADALAHVGASGAAVFINEVDVGTGERAPTPSNLQLAPMGDGTGEVLLLVATREIAGRLGRAQTAARSAAGMARMLAHEVKNPLAGIAGAAQLVSMNLAPEDREFTDLIVAETWRITKLLDQVEAFGDLTPVTPNPVNIHDVLDRARKSATLGVAARMRVVEDYDPSLPLTWGDADQLTQVVLNLLKNAAEAAGDAGGTVRLRSFYDPALRLRRPDGTRGAVPIHVEVSDDGPGLPEDIAAQVFEPFVSGRQTGTGLGLALVSKIVSDHNGWIAVDSAPGRTVFRVSLPVAPREEQT